MLVYKGMAKVVVENIVMENKDGLRQAIEQHIKDCEDWLKYLDAMKTTEDARNMAGSWIWSETKALDTHHIAGWQSHLHASIIALTLAGEEEQQ